MMYSDLSLYTFHVKFSVHSSIGLSFLVLLVCCSVLQCVAVCYIMLQFDTRSTYSLHTENFILFSVYSSICLSFLVSFSVLQCVAVCCVVLQYETHSTLFFQYLQGFASLFWAPIHLFRVIFWRVQISFHFCTFSDLVNVVFSF